MYCQYSGIPCVVVSVVTSPRAIRLGGRVLDDVDEVGSRSPILIFFGRVLNLPRDSISSGN